MNPLSPTARAAASQPPANEPSFALKKLELATVRQLRTLAIGSQQPISAVDLDGDDKRDTYHFGLAEDPPQHEPPLVVSCATFISGTLDLAMGWEMRALALHPQFIQPEAIHMLVTESTNVIVRDSRTNLFWYNSPPEHAIVLMRMGWRKLRGLCLIKEVGVRG